MTQEECAIEVARALIDTKGTLSETPWEKSCAPGYGQAAYNNVFYTGRYADLTVVVGRLLWRHPGGDDIVGWSLAVEDDQLGLVGHAQMWEDGGRNGSARDLLEGALGAAAAAFERQVGARRNQAVHLARSRAEYKPPKTLD